LDKVVFIGLMIKFTILTIKHLLDGIKLLDDSLNITITI